MKDPAGLSRYTWIKYATNATGTTGFTNTYNPGTTTYVGYAYNKTTATESSDPTDYTWSRLEGENADGNYTWIKYATNATGTTGFSNTYTAGTTLYIGMAFNNTTATESSDPTDYTWSKIEGEDGIPSFTWVKYATNATGTTGFTNIYVQGSTIYIGHAYNKTTATESSNYTDYTWSLFEGPAGASSRTVNLSTNKQVFAYDNAGLNPNPNTSTVTATAVNNVGTTYYHFYVNGVSKQNQTTNSYTYAPPVNFANLPAIIEVKLREGGTATTVLASDIMTVYGTKTTEDGQDAFTVVLSNEAHTIPATGTGAPKTNGYANSGTDIRVFLGTAPLSYGTGASTFSVTTNASGITPNASPTTVSLKTRRYGIASGMADTTTSATITYSIVARNAAGVATTFTKVQSFTKGNDGTDANTVDFYFKRIVAGGSTAAPGSGANANGTPSTLNGWYTDPANVPAGAGVIYTIKGTFNGTTWSWGDPIPLQGSLVRELSVFARQVVGAGVPGFVTGTNLQRYGSITFAIPGGAAESFTPPVGWDKTPQTLAADGDIIWEYRVVASGEPGQTVQPAGISGLTKYAERTDGDAGEDGESNIVAILSKANVIITANNDGTVPSGNFLGSGTDLQLFEGTTPIRYANSGTTSGTFAVGASGNGSVVSSSGITRGAGSQVGSSSSYFLRMADVSAMTTDTGTITFNIVGKKLDGTAFTPFSIVQSFSKSKAGISGNTGFLFVTALPSASNYEVGQVVIVEASAGAAQQGYIKVGASWVARDIVNHDIIFADAIRAEQLEISSSVAGGSSIFMNSTGTNNSIEIYDSGTLRVKIGKL